MCMYNIAKRGRGREGGQREKGRERGGDDRRGRG